MALQTNIAAETTNIMALEEIKAAGFTQEQVEIVLTAAASTGVKSRRTQQFTATVTGTANTSVTWHVEQGDRGGTITADGLYTAPSTAGTYNVVATSVADPNKRTVITVLVNAS